MSGNSVWDTAILLQASLKGRVSPTGQCRRYGYRGEDLCTSLREWVASVNFEPLRNISQSSGQLSVPKQRRKQYHLNTSHRAQTFIFPSVFSYQYKGTAYEATPPPIHPGILSPICMNPQCSNYCYSVFCQNSQDRILNAELEP